MRWANFTSGLRQDIGYALRTLRRQPGFAFVVLSTLGVGIGVNTAVFTLIDALMLRPLPVAHPEQLVTVGDPRRADGRTEGAPTLRNISYPLYQDLREQTRVVHGLYASGDADRLDVLTGRGTTVTHPRGRFISGNYFSVLGVPALAGRMFGDEEDRAAGASPVAVLNYAYWQRTFAGDRTVIGHTMSVNGVPLTIVGVAPATFTGDIVGRPTDVWIPITMQPGLMPHASWLTDRGISWLVSMGRLAPGATVTSARTELRALAARSITDHADAAEMGAVQRALHEYPLLVEPGAYGFSHDRAVYRRSLETLMAAVGLVLLVVCANVANLLLTRGVARGREISVRIAIGAARQRLVQQLITESLLLGVVGAALGLILAVVGSRALLSLAGGVTLQLGLDARVLWFAAVLSLGTALLFGVLPALRSTRVGVASALRTQGRSIGASNLILGRALVVAQVALSMLLVVGAGLMARSTIRLANADIGVARDQVVNAVLDATRLGLPAPRLAAFMRDLVARVQHVPGATAISLSENGLFSGTESATSIQVDGFTARADSDTLVAEDAVGPDYFQTVGAHLLRGRDIEASDNETAPKVAVVNASFARFFFPDGDAIGHHVQADSATWEIVGVVADIQQNAVRAEPVRRLYESMLQLGTLPTYFRLEIRASGDPERLATRVRDALVRVDPSLAVLDVNPLTDLIRDSITSERLAATMVSVFGLLALVLAALGLYGVMAYSTVRRTAEFGLRMALGAAPRAVAAMVLREAMLLTGLGMAIGLPLALILGRLIRGELFGIGLFDPPSIGLAMIALGLSGAVAAYLPATRAMRVAPLEAIHTE